MSNKRNIILEEAIRTIGYQSLIAEKIGISQSNLSRAIRLKAKLPISAILKLCILTDFEYLPHELDPERDYTYFYEFFDKFRDYTYFYEFFDKFKERPFI